MGNHIRKLIPLLASFLAVAGALLLSSCASIQRSQDEGDVRQIADLVNAGQAQKLAALSASPFLLDGEIVVLPADMKSFWEGIAKAGFKTPGASLSDALPVTPQSYQEFAATMEVKSFFSRYVKDGARLLRMTANDGSTRILILARHEWFSWRILGWKGPY
jgi:hypothetical protein